MKCLIPIENIERRIYVIRGQKVMLSPDLAGLYEVEPRALIQAVKRNGGRFPGDFMFQLTRQESINLKSQSVISSWGGRRAAPYAFTQEGVAMLSSILRSPRAAHVNVAIMRAFVKLREMVSAHKELAAKLAELERRIDGHDAEIKSVLDAIRDWLTPPEEARRKIGFRPGPYDPFCRAVPQSGDFVLTEYKIELDPLPASRCAAPFLP